MGKIRSRTKVRDLVCCSDCASDLTGTQAPGTNIYMARRTVDNSLDTFHIGLPGTIGAAMRVGHLDAKDHALVAKLALSHPLHLLAVIISCCAQIGTADILTEKEHKCKQNFEISKIFFRLSGSREKTVKVLRKQPLSYIIFLEKTTRRI